MNSNAVTSKTRQARVFLAVISIAVLAGCPKCAPDKVGDAVSRLTIRNVGAIVSLVNANKDCGFASPKVLGAPKFEGMTGGSGAIIFTVTDCVIDVPAGTEVSRGCDDAVTTAGGKVTVSATRRIAGTLTGKAESPVVPASADAVTIKVEKATFDNFLVESSTSKNSLKMVSGSIGGTISPRLAVSATTGACAIATPHVGFADVVYQPSKVYVSTPDNKFDVDVATSSLNAQSGTNQKTNALSGTIQVWDSTISADTDGKGLNPDYDSAAFDKSFACTADLATPVSFACADLTPRLADGAARLSVKAFGTVVSLLDANSACGFSSAAVRSAAVVNGTVGGMGSVTLTTTGCEINFPQRTELTADCSGAKTIATGAVTVTGTKTLTGRLTGNAMNPVVPMSDKPAEFALTLTFNQLKVETSTDTNALLLKSGTLTGKLSPRTTLSTATGACSISTPAALFTDLVYGNAAVALTSSSGTFDLALSASKLTATNGVWLETNALAGTIGVNGKTVTVPTDGKGLNPTFDRAAFDAAWQCAPGLVTPPAYQCVFLAPLAQGAARLTPRTLGAVTSLIDANTTCGFSSAAVAGTPTFTGTAGKDDGDATFTISTGCALNFPTEVTISTNCAGVTTKVSGTATVTGTKKVKGFRTTNPFQPVVPTTRDAAEFNLTVTFADFAVKVSDSTSALTVKNGTLSGVVSPRTGLDVTTGACSISTPVVKFTDLTWASANVRLVSDGSTFDLAAGPSQLQAQNGTRDAVSNVLTGSITLDGVAVAIPIVPTDNRLDPAFSQATFDSSYTCNPKLFVPTADVQCSFRGALGAAAARLLVKSAGVATRVLDKNTTCGFSATSVLSAPTNVTGTPGNPGSITWSANACAIGPLPAATTLSTNCVGTQTRGSGSLLATSTKTVTGLRGTNPPIIPVSRDAGFFDNTSMQFTTFELYDVAVDGGIATRSVLTGTAAFTVAPVGGESATTPGVFSIGTPLASFGSVAVPAAQMSIYNRGSRFDVALTAVALSAKAGMQADAGNSLTGTITVDGQQVQLGQTLLDPDYTQASFDATYVCTPDLAGVVPSN